jgi:PadR family transcriptional regulator, regulatory protein PadR
MAVEAPMPSASVSIAVAANPGLSRSCRSAYRKSENMSNLAKQQCNSHFFVYIEDMGEHSYLGEFELMVLLTIIRLRDKAYGVPLSRELAVRRGREISVGSVYAALDRLEAKGLVVSHLAESTPERGGRAKRYFRVTEQGLRTVHETRRVLSKLWQSLPSLGEELL